MSKVEKIQRDLLQKEAQFYSVHVSQTQTETPGTPNLQTLARGNPSWWHLVAFPSIKSCSDQAGASMAGGFLEEAEHSSADVLGVCKVRKAAGVAPWVLPSNSSRAQDSSSTFHVRAWLCHAWLPPREFTNEAAQLLDNGIPPAVFTRQGLATPWWRRLHTWPTHPDVIRVSVANQIPSFSQPDYKSFKCWFEGVHFGHHFDIPVNMSLMLLEAIQSTIVVAVEPASPLHYLQLQTARIESAPVQIRDHGFQRPTILKAARDAGLCELDIPDIQFAIRTVSWIEPIMPIDVTVLQLMAVLQDIVSHFRTDLLGHGFTALRPQNGSHRCRFTSNIHVIVVSVWLHDMQILSFFHPFQLTSERMKCKAPQGRHYQYIAHRFGIFQKSFDFFLCLSPQKCVVKLSVTVYSGSLTLPRSCFKMQLQIGHSTIVGWLGMSNIFDLKSWMGP